MDGCFQLTPDRFQLAFGRARLAAEFGQLRRRGFWVMTGRLRMADGDSNLTAGGFQFRSGNT